MLSITFCGGPSSDPIPCKTGHTPPASRRPTDWPNSSPRSAPPMPCRKGTPGGNAFCGLCDRGVCVSLDPCRLNLNLVFPLALRVETHFLFVDIHLNIDCHLSFDLICRTYSSRASHNFAFSSASDKWVFASRTLSSMAWYAAMAAGLQKRIVCFEVWSCVCVSLDPCGLNVNLVFPPYATRGNASVLLVRGWSESTLGWGLGEMFSF